jgi:hypothetical protein
VRRYAKWLALIVIVIIAVAPSISIAQEFYGGPTHLLSLSAQPTVYIGWITPNKATTFSLANNASNQFNIRSLEQTLNVQGVWTELLVPIKTSSPLGLILDFGYLFPSNKQSEETYNLTSGVAASRTWNTSSQLWNCSVAATYHMYPSMTGIMGFRYDSFMTNYKDPGFQVSQNLYLRKVDIAEFDFSGYLPFLGVMVEKTIGYGSSLKASLIGLPALFGSFVYKERISSSNLINSSFKDIYDPSTKSNVTVDYEDRWDGLQASNEFTSGYFLEAGGDLSFPISSWGQAGVFVKYSGVYGKTTTIVNSSASTNPTFNSNIPPNAKWSFSANNYPNQADTTFQRSNWIFGGTISACF